MNNYIVPKPRFPVSAKLYGGVVGLGLIGLGIVAFETFHLFHGLAVALFFGLVIEFGAVVESIGLAGGVNKKTWWIIPGLIVTLLVSGGYNYLTAARAGALLDPPVTGGLILAAVGVGPLAAVFFIAVQLGVKIHEHEAAVAKWEAGRQVWQDNQAAQAAREVQEAQQAAAQLELQKEEMRLRSQKEMQDAEIAARERAEKRAARTAARAAALRAAQTREPSAKEPRAGYDDFAAAMRSNGSHAVTAREIVERFGVKQRTAYDWLKKYHSAL